MVQLIVPGLDLVRAPRILLDLAGNSGVSRPSSATRAAGVGWGSTVIGVLALGAAVVVRDANSAASLGRELLVEGAQCAAFVAFASYVDAVTRAQLESS